jgi:hypothetical protein
MSFLNVDDNGSPLGLVHQAYRKLTHDELVIFLRVRNLPTSGADTELASRLTQHDLHTYHFPFPADVSPHPDVPRRVYPEVVLPDLPIEILAEIMHHVGDWELATAVGVRTTLPLPLEWTRASTTDYAIITGHLPTVRAADLSAHPPTRVGATVAVRFAYIDLVEFFLTQHHALFLSIFKDDLIPIKASRHGRTAVLSWWKHVFEHHPDLISAPKPGTIAECIDGASRNGQISSLDWWLLSSGLPFDYTEAALEYASARNQIAVLDWWKHQNKATGLPLKVGKVMDLASMAGHVNVLEWWAASQLEPKYDRYAMYHASCNGKVDVLAWWLGSGLQLIFDQDALTGASRHNRPEVLDWWYKCGLPIQYRICDIEEALEDAIGGGEAAKKWWKSKGVDFTANHEVWTKLQNLN